MGLFGLLPPNIDRLKARRDVDRLIEALAWGLKKPEVAAAAARALGELKDPRAAPPLRQRLRDFHCRATIEALAAIGDREAIEPLIWQLGFGPNRAVVVAALRTFGPEAVTKAAALLESSHCVSQSSCIAALVSLGGPDAVAPLIAAFSSALEADRDAILRTLAGFPAATVEAAARLLRDEDDGARRAAVDLLESVGERAAVVDLLVPLLDDEAGLSSKAARALRARGWTPATTAHRVLFAAVEEDWLGAIELANGSLDLLLTVVRRHTPFIHHLVGLVLALARAVPDWPARVPPPLALAVLEPALDTNNIEARLAVISALGQVADSGAAELLIAGVKEPIGGREVYQATQAALQRLGPHATAPLVRALAAVKNAFAADRLAEIGEPAVDALISALGDNKAAGPVAGALGRLRSQRAVQPLAEALLKSTDHAWSITQALVEIGGPAATAALVKAVKKRRIGAAIDALGNMGDATAIGPLVDVVRKARGAYEGRNQYSAVRSLEKLLPGKEALVSLDVLRALESLPDPHWVERTSSDYSWDQGTTESGTIDLEWARVWARNALAAREAGG